MSRENDFFAGRSRRVNKLKIRIIIMVHLKRRNQIVKTAGN